MYALGYWACLSLNDDTTIRPANMNIESTFSLRTTEEKKTIRKHAI